ncbi:MATE efflux family protein ALF5 [Tetrabaena socialis]|uniref:Protein DETOXIFICATION n=1 Tax=Tetrabaena socialis TaxID=47790 RepID=A0A2J7ZXL0_9CHLO|nr:MATE efflux family protein ALF5 [Tetrabaena socialis]|eukprot:PNH05010.1 MATE efflux family protein ALF5 [Tetrabaena socialis]
MQLAAAAIGNNVAVMLGRLVLLGLCGALDTLAAQAWGAGKEARLPLLLQRTVLFLWAHSAAISASMLALPAGLAALGQDPQLTAMVRRYLLALLPSVWLEGLSRPITRVLVARGTATPQMIIALIGLPLSVGTNWALVVAARWEYVGAAAATSVAAGYDVVMLLLYVACSGQWDAVMGVPNTRAFRGWHNFARLAYPAALMKCAESWAFTLLTLAASLLPHAAIATAAVGVSYNVYGVLFIAFVACSTAACVTVGNRLGAGNAKGAKLAAAASLLIVPAAWSASAAALLLPRSQAAIISLFVGQGGGVDGGGGADADAEALRQLLHPMFGIVAWLVLLDGVQTILSGVIQTILSGVIQGCGRQQQGALVNAVAFYMVAVPLALFLAFRFRLPLALGGGEAGLGMGPQGLYLGIAAGPLIQMVSYAVILLRTNWERASEAAVLASMLCSTNSLGGLMRRIDPGALAGGRSDGRPKEGGRV